MAPLEVDYVETDSPGFVDARIAIQTSWMHQRLRKRYGKSLPFGNATGGEVPEILLGWLTALVTLDVMRRRGMNPSDPVAQMYAEDVTRVQAEIKEAADSKDGLFDISGTETATDPRDSSVSTGGPLGYSETSPYVWTGIERVNGRGEDRNGGGTGD